MTQGSDGGPKDSTLRFWEKKKKGKIGLRENFVKLTKKEEDSDKIFTHSWE